MLHLIITRRLIRHLIITRQHITQARFELRQLGSLRLQLCFGCGQLRLCGSGALVDGLNVRRITRRLA